MKFLGYSKEKQKAEAKEAREGARLTNTPTLDRV
jgi:hypothetical protein